MKKCIFWDDEDNKFLTWDEVEFEKLKNEEVTVWKQIDPITKECRLFESFDDTELKDINGKSIYADSSIVEITLANRYKTKGYFYFDMKNLRYFFAFIDLHVMAVEKFSEYYKKAHSHNYIDEKIFWSMEYSCELFSDIEIIDTIQENKLGLIK